jgi:hypothetical protein
VKGSTTLEGGVVEPCPPTPRLERAWEIVDLTVTTALDLAAVWAIVTGRATESVAAVLWIAFRGLRAARRRGR